MTDHYESRFRCNKCDLSITTILPKPRCWHCFGPMERVETVEATATAPQRNVEDASAEPVVEVPVDLDTRVTIDVLKQLAGRMEIYAHDQIAFNRKGWGTKKEKGHRIVRAGLYKELAEEFRNDAKKLEKSNGK